MKILLALLIYGFIIYTLKTKLTDHSLDEIARIILSVPLMALVIPLWCLNILTEGLKWRVLTEYICKMSIKESIISVLQGFAIGILTPFRIGEWPGRVLHFNTHRKAGITLAIIGSIFQNLVIAFTGGLLLIFLLQEQSVFKFNIYYLLLVITVLISIAGMVYILKRKKGKIYFQSIQDVLNNYPMRWYFKVLGITYMRFFIFSAQLAIFLLCLTDIPLGKLIIIMPVYFFVITFVPSYSLIEPGIRISSGLLLFSAHSEFYMEISSAILLLWILNVGFTAAIGTIVIFNHKSSALTDYKLKPIFKYVFNPIKNNRF